MKKITLLLLVALISLFSLMSLAQDNVFIMQGDEPSIAHTASSRDNRSYEYHEQYTDPGAVVYHDGLFHMFRNGFLGWPAAVWIHHMVSEDGITWTQPSQEPVLLTEDVPFAEVASLASSVIVEDDGTWVMYFYTWNSDGAGEIGRATASGPQGEWTVDPEPVLVPEADWEMSGVIAPQVLKTEDGYLMYYSGSNNAEMVSRIGLATSEDGITWEKSEANPILEPSEDWEGSTVHQPRVVETENGYLMAYRAWTGQRGEMALGIARSDDGITWTRSANNPYLTMEMLPEFNAFWYTALEEVDGTLYLYLEMAPRTNTTDIYTLTADLDDIE
jgi:predicted GH43/DUF377 family glycosyl hydrolase